MKRFFCSAIFLVSCLSAFSQKEYFIYLQSEAEQAFFVRMNDNTYNSSQAGYLILSKLKDSSYSFKVGFPQNKWPDQQFSVTVGAKDHGFLLKDFGEKGWGLFNLQTLSVQMASVSVAKATKKEAKVVSVFTETLSKAANDPSLKEGPVFAVVRNEEKSTNSPEATVKADLLPQKEQPPLSPVNIPGNPAKKTDTVFTAKNELNKATATDLTGTETRVKIEDSLIVKVEAQRQLPSTSVTEEPVTGSRDQLKEQAVTAKENTPAADNKEVVAEKDEVMPPKLSYKKSTVVKKAESSTTEGFGLTFIDEYADGQKDTIQIIIPNTLSILEIAKEQQADQKKFLDLDADSKESKPPVQKNVEKESCSAVASANDFFRLRKKMAGQKQDDLMINEAKKEFKSKCFSVEQIRNLGNLLLNEAGKFQFYEVAYPVCHDKGGFAALQAEFKDPYFVHRFKNLVN